MKYSRAVVLALCVVAQNGAHAQDFAERMAQGAFEKLLAESTAPQTRATMNTFLGRPDFNPAISGIPRASMDCPVGDAVQVDGAAWVLEHAESRKLLMFNENHYGIQARTFVYELLPQLRELGFTHMGFEAVQPGAEKDGRISPAAGYYTVEPVFAALVRLAADLGFQVFAYESTDKAPEGASVAEQVRIRELAQSRNIQGVIESASTDARFIVFAGWSHIAEIALDGWGEKTRWMAANLKESTGIDPLTIDLSGCAYASRNNHDWRGRAFLSENDVPVISGQYSGAVDAQIHLPIPVEGDASAAGYFRKSLGAAFPVPEALLPSEEPILVQAYKLGEEQDGVAFDRILLRPGENLPLYLPRGKYELIGHRGSGELVNKVVVEIE